LWPTYDDRRGHDERHGGVLDLAAGEDRAERAGLPTYGKRRVPGLRREKVASLAGVSIDYYKRAHLLDLARAASPIIPRPRRAVQQRVRPVIRSILDAVGTPALVRNSRVDYLAANQLGRALYALLFESREQPANSARFTFLDPGSASKQALDILASWTATLDPADGAAGVRDDSNRH
jgi:hypothetical protein